MKSLVKERYLENLYDELKPFEEWFNDPEVTDLFINPDSRFYVKKFGKGRIFIDHINEERTMNIILFTASILGVTVNEKSPELSGVLPYKYKSRIHAVIPPWTTGASIAIRKQSGRIISIDDYVKEERITKSRVQFLLDAIKAKKNIIIAGGTGSGKTTFLNALLKAVSKLCPSHRLYIIEDTKELQSSSEDVVPLCVMPHETAQAVRAFLRFNPDRIIFGELRYGDTTYALLNAWNTGHPGGFSTIHADSAETVISRIYDLVQEAVQGQYNINNIYRTINCIVHLVDQAGFGPVVREVAEIEYNNSGFKLKPVS